MKTLLSFLLLLGSLSIFAEVGEKPTTCEELLQGEKRVEGERKEDPNKKKGDDKPKKVEGERSV